MIPFQGMRRFFLALIFALLPLPALAASEGENETITTPQYSFNEAMTDPQKRIRLLDDLYLRLKSSPTAADAIRVDATIDAMMQRTGHAAADMFMQWGEDSLKAGNTARALDYFDEAVQLSPNAPEPYFKRGSVFYARNDFAKAIADMEHAHMLEPRHLGALMGLGTLFSDIGRAREALAAYAAALDLNPHNEDAQKVVEPLRKKVEGEGI